MTTPDERLEAIYNLVTDQLASGRDMMVSTWRLLNEVKKLSETTIEEVEDMPITEEKVEDPVIVISCDASIKVNPGGAAAIGAVIRFPDETKPLSLAKLTSATTNNEAEYDAIYEGLLALVNLHNRPKYPITVRSDSQLVVKQLEGKYKINNVALQRKCTSIHELAAKIPVPVKIEWRPRNSTPDLTQANFNAQDALGVKRH